MDIHILTLFPGMFDGPFRHSVIARAVSNGLVRVHLRDIRQYTHDGHHTADDYQYGGGAGMVMKPGPVFEAVDDALSAWPEAMRGDVPVILLSPQGRLLDQKMAEHLSSRPGMILICGHYEGVDERVREGLATDDISIGDYVLTGGELAAMVVADAVVRLLPGVVGSAESVQGDSITSGLLQHPVYTRPPVHRGLEVPPVLLSGNHGEVARWRRQQALLRTLARRPDLLERADLSEADLEFLASHGYKRGSERPGRLPASGTP
jgi:tRNA (guanine37-N1)-methyltransferase